MISGSNHHWSASNDRKTLKTSGLRPPNPPPNQRLFQESLRKIQTHRIDPLPLFQRSGYTIDENHHLLEWPAGPRPASAFPGNVACCLIFARTPTIQIATIFENLHVTGYNLMRNYHLSIPNWPYVPRCSQSSAVSPSAL